MTTPAVYNLRESNSYPPSFQHERVIHTAPYPSFPRKRESTTRQDLHTSDHKRSTKAVCRETGLPTNGGYKLQASAFSQTKLMC
jgi:hypothetical protein